MVEAQRPILTDPQNVFGLTESDVRSARQEVHQRLIDFSPDRSSYPLVFEGMGRQLAALMREDDPEDILQRVKKFNDRFDELKKLGEDKIGAVLLREFPDILDHYPLLEKTRQGQELNMLLSVAKAIIDRRPWLTQS